MFIIIYVLFVIIIIFSIYIQTYIETFYIENKIIYTICDNNDNISNGYYVTQLVFQNMIIDIKNNNTFDLNDLKLSNNSNVVIYIDPYIDYYIFKNIKNNEIYKDGIFICLSKDKLSKNDCIWNIEGKTIAYNYISDYLFLQALIKGYRLNKEKIILKKIDKDLNVDFDYLFTYAVIGSKYMDILEKSNHFINGFKDVDINRLKAFYPFLRENYGNLREYFSNDSYKTYVSFENNILIPYMNYKIINNVNTIERFITRLDQNDSTNNENYGCYGNMQINNKNECDSLYTIDGKIKSYYSIWDKKCSNNNECPYFNSNRGGCNDGYCEFPVGVKRLGFTKYDDKEMNSPFCYGCDIDDYECCNNKKDYVFGGDFKDRQKKQLKTIVSPLDYLVVK